MAIDVNQKVINLASDLVSVAENIMNATRQGMTLKAIKENNGFDLTDYDALFAATEGLKHVDGGKLNNIITSIIAIDTFLTANYHDDNLDQARR